MKKAMWLLLLATLLACGPTTAESQPTELDVEEETAVVQEEAGNDSATEVESGTESTADLFAPAAANLDEFTPASSVEEAAVVREQDWRIGAPDPIVVIIEYGDFQ